VIAPFLTFRLASKTRSEIGEQRYSIPTFLKYKKDYESYFGLLIKETKLPKMGTIGKLNLFYFYGLNIIDFKSKILKNVQLVFLCSKLRGLTHVFLNGFAYIFYEYSLKLDLTR